MRKIDNDDLYKKYLNDVYFNKLVDTFRYLLFKKTISKKDLINAVDMATSERDVMSESESEEMITIEEVIVDEMYAGKVQQSMENGTYFEDSMNRIKELERALLWCSGAKCFRTDAENAFINTVQPLLKNNWF